MENKIDLKRIVEMIGKSPVVLYGAGKYGKHALDNIKKNYPEINVKYFIDDNQIRNNSSIDGIEIVSLLEAMKTLNEDFHIFITNYYVKEVIKKIELTGFDLSKVYFINELLIADVDHVFAERFRGSIQQVYNLLEDYQSRMIYKTLAESRFTKNIDLLSRTFDLNQYFPEEDFFRLTKDEVFVDAGAFDGDTIEEFRRQTNCNYKYIYAFEPDKTNYEKLARKELGANVKIYNAGLYDSTKQLSFSANKGGSSKVEDVGDEIIQVYCFDDLEIPEKKITFVKMDIEGSELKALEGMKETIKNCKPKLAICMYHKYEDLWELPLYIKELVPQYKLYIRNYTTYLDEVVLYATL